jgi:hypothetical protein
MASINSSGEHSSAAGSFSTGLPSSSTSTGMGNGDNSDFRYALRAFERPDSGKNWIYSRKIFTSCSPRPVVRTLFNSPRQRKCYRSTYLYSRNPSTQ